MVITPTTITLLPLILLIPAYALADRFVGGGWPALDARLPGRSLLWAALAVMVLGALLGGWAGLAYGLAWSVQRSFAWGVFGGSIAPETRQQVLGTAARHMIGAPLLALAAAYLGENPFRALAIGMIYAAFATGLAAELGARVIDARSRGLSADPANAGIELSRGAGWGVGVVVLVLIHAQHVLARVTS